MPVASPRPQADCFSFLFCFRQPLAFRFQRLCSGRRCRPFTPVGLGWAGSPCPPSLRLSPGPCRDPIVAFPPLGGGCARCLSSAPDGWATVPARLFTGPCSVGFCGSPTGGVGLFPHVGLGRWLAAGGAPPRPFLGMMCRPPRGRASSIGCATSYNASLTLLFVWHSYFVVGSGRGALMSHRPREVSFRVGIAMSHIPNSSLLSHTLLAWQVLRGLEPARPPRRSSASVGA